MTIGVTRAYAAALGAVLVVAGAGSAHAQPDPVPPAPPSAADPASVAGAPARPASKDERSWYGWQTLVTDGVAVGLFAVAEAVRDDPTALAVSAVGAWGSYIFGGPAIHVAHHRYGVALGDLGLRVGAPLLLALAVVAVTGPNVCTPGEFCPGLAVVAVGYLGAMAVDSAVLAWSSESSPVAQVKRAHAWLTGVQITPLVWPIDRGVNAGVGGAF